jgi:transposase
MTTTFTAGAKEDRRDAKVLASAPRTDPDCLRPVQEPDDDVIQMRGAARARKELVQDLNAIANRIRQHLVDYYPQFLHATDGDVTTPWAIDLWKRLPTPEKARRVRKSTLAKLLAKHRIRRIDADQLADRLKAQPIKRRNASVESARNRILSLLPILEQYNAQIDKARRQLEQTLKLARKCRPDHHELRDAAILDSIPGIGDHVLTTLLTEAEQALGQRDHKALRCLAGVAPVTVRSGNRKTVRLRRAKNHRLADAVYHWARVAV